MKARTCLSALGLLNHTCTDSKALCCLLTYKCSGIKVQLCSYDVLSYHFAAVHRAWLPLGCRKAIRELGTPVSAELADKPDLALREAVQESGLLMHCRGAFIVSSTGNAAQEPLRKLAIWPWWDRLPVRAGAS